MRVYPQEEEDPQQHTNYQVERRVGLESCQHLDGCTHMRRMKRKRQPCARAREPVIHDRAAEGHGVTRTRLVLAGIALTILALCGAILWFATPKPGGDSQIPADAVAEWVAGEQRRIPGIGGPVPDSVFFLNWFDDIPRLASTGTPSNATNADATELRLSTGDPLRYESMRLPRPVRSARMAADNAGMRVLICFCRSTTLGGPRDSIVALGPDLRVTWEFPLAGGEPSQLAVVPLVQSRPVVCMAAGGGVGLLALDLEGHRLWQTRGDEAEAGLAEATAIRVHAKLPGVLLSLGTHLALWNVSSSGATSLGRPVGPLVGHFFDALLVPDGLGRPSILACGLAEGDIHSPVICRIDWSGKTAWQVPCGVLMRQLALLEPVGGPRIVVAASGHGEIFTVDEFGKTGRHGGVFADRKGAPGVLTHICAGQLGLEGWGIAVRSLRTSFLYSFDSAVDVLGEAPTGSMGPK